MGDVHVPRVSADAVGPLLLCVVGASGAGKTTVLDELRPKLDGFAVHDFDEIGVPEGATFTWRQEANELWLQRLLAETDDLVLLAGQTPLGELLATPSAVRLRGIACCLLDCDDDVRVERLAQRGTPPEVIGWSRNWAAWLRRHAVDPQWHQEVIRHAYEPAGLVWERWAEWQEGDPRWSCEVIDNSGDLDDVVASLAAWARAARDRDDLPLSGAWWD